MTTNLRTTLDTAASVLMIAASIAILYSFVRTPAVPTVASAAVEPLPNAIELGPLHSFAAIGIEALPVALIEYTDFQCPYCRTFTEEIFPKLRSDFIDTGRIAFAVQHFPLSSIHPQASFAAGAAHCMGAQGRFWQMHDWLFAHTNSLDRSSILEGAFSLGASEKLLDCISSEGERAIEQSRKTAAGVGIQGTPTFLIAKRNELGSWRAVSRLKNSSNYQAFTKALEQALAGN